MVIALSLGFLAMSLGVPAFAGDLKAADRGARNPVVAYSPSKPTLPISVSRAVLDDGGLSGVFKPGVGGPWNHTLMIHMYALALRTRPS